MHRLLIVDDERHVVDWLYELFTELPDMELDIHKAYSGEEAITTLNNIKIDIIVADIRMPGMNGLELADKIFENWPECKVIFLTGYNEFDYIYKAIKHEGISYLLKTEDDEAIVNAVKKAMESLEKNLRDKALYYIPDMKEEIMLNENKNNSIIKHIKTFIDENISGDLSLSCIADHMNYNPSYISRLFKQITGVNLFDYIKNIRMQKAIQLLQTTNENINNIAVSAGYGSSQYFATVFRKINGLTPQEYREAFLNR